MNIDGETQIFGVVGDPIDQVKTPSRINSIFESRNSNIVCVPLHATKSNFLKYWQGVKKIKNIIGFGVTVPHKKSAMQLCDSVSSTAKKLGVVNVVRRQPDGGFHGDNFDGLSFVKGLISEGFDPKEHKIFIYGAGGAATAICYSLIDAGAESISIQNRTLLTAQGLVTQLQRDNHFSQIYAVENFDHNSTMVINASSLGMKEDDPLPVNIRHLNAGQIVAEVVAKPEITKFLHEAHKIGCPVHSGIHMINHQMSILADFIENRGKSE